jgi:hypothetical protein
LNNFPEINNNIQINANINDNKDINININLNIEQKNINENSSYINNNKNFDIKQFNNNLIINNNFNIENEIFKEILKKVEKIIEKLKSMNEKQIYDYIENEFNIKEMDKESMKCKADILKNLTNENSIMRKNIVDDYKEYVRLIKENEKLEQENIELDESNANFTEVLSEQKIRNIEIEKIISEFRRYLNQPDTNSKQGLA